MARHGKSFPHSEQMRADPKAPPTPVQITDATMTRFDTNADSNLSLTEVQAKVPASTTASADSLTSLFEATDTDKNALVSKLELQSAFEAKDANADGFLQKTELQASSSPNSLIDLLKPGKHGPLPNDNGIAISTIEKTIDTRWNTDGQAGISLLEVQAKFGSGAITHHWQTVDLTSIFGGLDTDKDNLIASNEISQALAAKDVNSDGLLTRVELHPAANASIDLIGILAHLHIEGPHGG